MEIFNFGSRLWLDRPIADASAWQSFLGLSKGEMNDAEPLRVARRKLSDTERAFSDGNHTYCAAVEQGMIVRLDKLRFVRSSNVRVSLDIHLKKSTSSSTPGGLKSWEQR